MTIYSKIFFSVIFITFCLAGIAQAATAPAGYTYAHNEAEYSILLPEAPTVKTVWAEPGKHIPYLEKPSKDSALGEVATFKRVDIETEDTFEAKITFLRADHDFLQNLNEEKIKKILEDEYKNSPLSDGTFNYSASAGPLKWATLTGFSVDRNGHPAFNALHYLTGQQSILVVQVAYSVEDKAFQDYYKNMVDSITYLAP